MAGPGAKRRDQPAPRLQERVVIAVSAMFFGGLGLMVAVAVPFLGGAAVHWPDDQGAWAHSIGDYVLIGAVMLVPAALSAVLLVVGVALGGRVFGDGRVAGSSVVVTAIAVWVSAVGLVLLS